MKIISKYKDYYDFVAKLYGEDPKIVFNRKPDEFETTINYTANESDFYSELARIMFDENRNLPSYSIYSKTKTPPKSYIDCIIVCGKLYIMKYDLITTIPPYQFKQTELLTIHEYFDEFSKDDNNIWRINRMANLCNSEDKYITLNINFGSPIVYLKNGQHYTMQNKLKCHVVTNLSLLEHQFETKITAFQMFQDIQMFISNHMISEVKIEQIEDKYKIIQHGFNKQSFRHRKRT